ncbi:acylphosphatase [Candidatus Magnetoovum chiemensis]|nr:acylphosphatase [Candidatus Magnetoovum chiemensis]
MSDKIRAYLIIEGRVQGVGFRYFTRDAARKNKIYGWVRNCFDGTVEAVFEGDKIDVEKTVAECYKGPYGSIVTNIKLQWQPYRDEFSGFSIKH